MASIEKIQSEYPLHWAVWNDDHKELQDLIKTKHVSAQANAESASCECVRCSYDVITVNFVAFCQLNRVQNLQDCKQTLDKRMFSVTACSLNFVWSSLVMSVSNFITMQLP